jgi:hypothetical protein
VITVAYRALVSPIDAFAAGASSKDAAWFPVSDLPAQLYCFIHQ